MTSVHFGHCVCLGSWLLTTDHDNFEFACCDPKSGCDTHVVFIFTHVMLMFTHVVFMLTHIMFVFAHVVFIFTHVVFMFTHVVFTLTHVVFMFTGRPVMNMDYRPVEYKWWAEGEPNGREEGDHCVGMDTGRHPGRWVDMDCGRPAHFACRMEISQLTFLVIFLNLKFSRPKFIINCLKFNSNQSNCVKSRSKCNKKLK